MNETEAGREMYLRSGSIGNRESKTFGMTFLRVSPSLQPPWVT